jgi:4-amino-4-deoxy-L-arabinose transferase-like glycosyltransferase
MEIKHSKQKYFLIFILLMACLLTLSFQGSRGLYETSEGRYAECAREMLEKSEYLIPQLNYQPHFTKPPLTYWAIACGLKLFGNNEWGARFYNSVAFVLTTLVIIILGTSLWHKETGLLAGLIYASSPFPLFGAFSVTTDTLLTLWVATTVLCYVKASKATLKKSQYFWILGMWFFCGLGTLTKGPAALIFLLPIFIWHFLHKKPFKIIHPIGILSFVLIGCSWYFTECLNHPNFFSFILGEEFFGRFTSDLGNHNTAPNTEWYKPFMMYLPALTLGAGPWLVPLVQNSKKKLIFCFCLIRNKSLSGESFLLFVFFIPLVIFFIAKSRLYLYVLPLYTFVTLAIACSLEPKINGTTNIKKVINIAILTGIVLLTVKAAIVYLPSRKNMKPVYTLCCQVKNPDTKFYAFEEPKLFGLQFYLKGNLQRIYIAEEKKGISDSYLKDIIPQIQSAQNPESNVIICDKNNFTALKDQLQKDGITVRPFSTRYWVVCQINKQ